MNNQQQELFTEFFQSFSKAVTKTLSKSLDSDVCKKISCNFKAVAEINDAEEIKNDNVLYRIDYATGRRQGGALVLIPEVLLANISDILTGGEGKDSYKGSLSEIETNSVAPIMTKIFKEVESSFKQAYSHDLLFSANSQVILKEMSEYQVNSGNVFFDLIVEYSITLNEGEEYNISVLLTKSVTEQLLADLGFSEGGGVQRKTVRNNIDLSCLSDIKINITAELGKTQVPIKYALELVGGSVVELDTQNNADIKVYANGVEFAYAQIVAIEDNFGLKITRILTPEERRDMIK